jgi:hypothetical protein
VIDVGLSEEFIAVLYAQAPCSTLT